MVVYFLRIDLYNPKLNVWPGGGEMRYLNTKGALRIGGISTLFFLLIAVFILIMFYIHALDVEYAAHYLRSLEPLSDMELRFIKEYREYKKSPEASKVDFSKRIVQQRIKELVKGVHDMRREKELIDMRRDFRNNILSIGVVAAFSLIVLAYIILRNQ